MPQTARERLASLRLREADELDDRLDMEGRLELQQAAPEAFRLVQAAGQREERGLQRVQDAEARVCLYRLRAVRGGFVVAPLTDPDDRDGDVGLEAGRVERTEPQRAWAYSSASAGSPLVA